MQVTFKQDGSKISGLFKSPMGELPFQNGTLTGNDLTFSVSSRFRTVARRPMTGKVDGPSMTGKAQFGGFGEGDWTRSASNDDRVRRGARAYPSARASPSAGRVSDFSHPV